MKKLFVTSLLLLSSLAMADVPFKLKCDSQPFCEKEGYWSCTDHTLAVKATFLSPGEYYFVVESATNLGREVDLKGGFYDEYATVEKMGTDSILSASTEATGEFKLKFTDDFESILLQLEKQNATDVTLNLDVQILYPGSRSYIYEVCELTLDF